MASLLKRLRRMLTPTRPAIVMYHRIAAQAVDPWGLCVSPANFAAQITALARTRTILPMDRFAARLAERTLPANALGITFDDGYLDNLEHAAPILAAADVPATLFLATRFSERGEPYWWDELAALVLDALPLTTTVEIGGASMAIALPPREPDDDRRTGWRAWNPRTAREHLHYRLWDAIRALPRAQANEAVSGLRRIFPTPPEPAQRPMNAEELRTLTSSAPFTIGGHTASHPDLSTLGADAATAEIAAGRDWITETLGAPPVGFAYPYGRHAPATPDLVRAAGFAWACTTAGNTVSRASSLWELPRVAAPDVPDIAWLP